jgi:hypothetical protein
MEIAGSLAARSAFPGYSEIEELIMRLAQAWANWASKRYGSGFQPLFLAAS